MVCGAAEVMAIFITPQFVVIVIVFANFLSTLFGCFTVAGVCAFDVGVAQPATVVGRSAAVAKIEVNEVMAITRAQNAEILFTVEFLFPLDRSRWLASHIQHNSINFTNLIGNSRRNLFQNLIWNS